MNFFEFEALFEDNLRESFSENEYAKPEIVVHASSRNNGTN